MRYGLLMGAALGVGLLCQPNGGASAQKHAPAKQATPPPQPQPTELVAIKDAVERIARAQEAERTQRDAEKDDTRAADDLKAQQSMGEAARWMLWPSWVGAIAGVAGVIALIGTFREQRKMTAATTRAYLGVTDVNAGLTEDELAVLIEVSNTGPTDATDVKFNGTVFYEPESDFTGPLPEDPMFYQDIAGELPSIPAKSAYLIPADGPAGYPQHSSDVRPGFMVRGKIIYKDAFGDRHSLNINAVAGNLTSEQYSTNFALFGDHTVRRNWESFQREMARRKKHPAKDKRRGTRLAARAFRPASLLGALAI